jgi:hypothetical protein
MSSKIQNLLPPMADSKNNFKSVVVVTDDMRLIPPDIPLEMDEDLVYLPSLPNGSQIPSSNLSIVSKNDSLLSGEWEVWREEWGTVWRRWERRDCEIE